LRSGGDETIDHLVDAENEGLSLKTNGRVIIEYPRATAHWGYRTWPDGLLFFLMREHRSRGMDFVFGEVTSPSLPTKI